MSLHTVCVTRQDRLPTCHLRPRRTDLVSLGGMKAPGAWVRRNRQYNGLAGGGFASVFKTWRVDSGPLHRRPPAPRHQ